MPKLNGHPTYRKHKASGQAIVKIEGQAIYLGPHGSKASIKAFDDVISLWTDNGRRLPKDLMTPFTITELCVAYFKRCKKYYRKNGVETDEVETNRQVLNRLRGKFGDSMVNEYGPRKLKEFRQLLIEIGWARTHINKQIGRIKRMFHWAVEEEMIEATIFLNLDSVAGLKAGRTNAKEPKPVRPVDEAVINKTLEKLGPVPADMVRLQRLTGARPSEICLLRPCDIDQTSDSKVWLYRPQSHKTEHHDKERIIPFGPEAQGLSQDTSLIGQRRSFAFHRQSRLKPKGSKKEPSGLPLSNTKNARKSRSQIAPPRTTTLPQATDELFTVRATWRFLTQKIYQRLSSAKLLFAMG